MKRSGAFAAVLALALLASICSRSLSSPASQLQPAPSEDKMKAGAPAAELVIRDSLVSYQLQQSVISRQRAKLLQQLLAPLRPSDIARRWAVSERAPLRRLLQTQVQFGEDVTKLKVQVNVRIMDSTPEQPAVPQHTRPIHPVPGRHQHTPVDASQLPDPQYFALCLAVKDQAGDIREWLGHHRKLGVGKIYVFDNNSTPPMQAAIQDFIDAGLVSYHYFVEPPPGEKPQLWVYNTCLQRYGPSHTWMGFLDADEFLIIRDGTPHMPALLKDYEAYGGLGVNWVMFGSSNRTARPPNGTLGSYWQCLPLDHVHNLHIKTIVQTKYAVKAEGPHHFIYTPGRSCVTELGEPLTWAMSERNSVQRVALFHYVLKSLEDFKAKAARGSAMRNKKGLNFFHMIDRSSHQNCSDAWTMGYAERASDIPEGL